MHVLLHIENKDRLPPLMQAIYHEDNQIVSLLLKLRANPNHCNDIIKISPLMAAVFRGHLEIANLLIKKGADPNLRDINERTILHHAVDSGKIDNVQYALKCYNNINCQDNQGWTPLHRAVILGLNNDIITLLISKGADKKIKDKNGFDVEKHFELTTKQNNKQNPKLQQQTKRFKLCKGEKRQTIFPNLLSFLDTD